MFAICSQERLCGFANGSLFYDHDFSRHIRGGRDLLGVLTIHLDLRYDLPTAISSAERAQRQNYHSVYHAL
jgi:hypothetical protein